MEPDGPVTGPDDSVAAGWQIPTPDCSVPSAGLSVEPDVPVQAPDVPVGGWNLSFPTLNLTKSCPIFTTIDTGYLRPIPKLFPKDQLKMITGLAGISDRVKRQASGKKKGKLKFNLLVANLQV